MLFYTVKQTKFKKINIKNYVPLTAVLDLPTIESKIIAIRVNQSKISEAY